MKFLIKKVPLSISGLMLGFAGLGSLTQNYSELLRTICGLITAFILLLLILKILMYPKLFKEDMSNPISASVFCTFPMTLALLTTYIKPLFGQGSYILWLFALFMHIVCIIYFTVSFIFRLDLTRVYASYYIVYVGIAIVAVTAPVHNRREVGEWTFWFGFITFAALFILISARYVKHTRIPASAHPLICIYAAPVSLCIAGYVESASTKDPDFIMTMLGASIVLYLFALIKAFYYIKERKFYPSYSSFTFPFVITAIASKLTMGYMVKIQRPVVWLPYQVWFETAIAAVMVVYVFIKYMKFIFGTDSENGISVK